MFQKKITNGGKQNEKYYIVRMKCEVKDYDSIREGCTMAPDVNPERVEECDNYTDAIMKLTERETTIYEYKGHAGIRFYQVTEYWLEEVTIDEYGDEIDWDFPAVTEM